MSAAQRNSEKLLLAAVTALLVFFILSLPVAPVAVLLVVAASLPTSRGRSLPEQPLIPTDCCRGAEATAACACATAAAPTICRVYYASQGGTSKGLALRFAAALNRYDNSSRADVVDACTLPDPESLATAEVAVLFVSTYDNGSGPPGGGAFFTTWFADAAVDERVGAAFLSRTRFAVFGCASSAYGHERYNAAAISLDASLAKLGAQRIVPVAAADADAADAGESAFAAWTDAVVQRLQRSGNPSVGPSPTAAPKLLEDDDAMSDDGGSDRAGSESDVDIEDLGGAHGQEAPVALKEMVTPKVRATLTKQGYRVLGSHSGVKLCRWTKSMLRGRGGCYKHAFYGIQSHRCMEATPSLACANKCTFCWRHNSHPVGTTWRWAMDAPETIVAAALAEHASMVKQLRGCPGVTQERIDEGMRPRHCALSLVGEPIFYPRINELVGMLHDAGISTFLVTNGQFPDAIQAMRPVTQLYVSVDAATPESLVAIDRPLFSDAWRRLKESLTLLRSKRQRTVYRLTLVQGQNMRDGDAAAYAQLMTLGMPDLVEIKGVTYCGTGGAVAKGQEITMQSVPFHTDVVKFALEVAAAAAAAGAGEYGLACEHSHSCCTLLARRDKYLRDGGVWWTHIDYDKFNALVRSGATDFSAADYAAPTPEWALAGAPEGGFDPNQQRFRKVRNHPGKQTDHDEE